MWRVLAVMLALMTTCASAKKKLDVPPWGAQNLGSRMPSQVLRFQPLMELQTSLENITRACQLLDQVQKIDLTATRESCDTLWKRGRRIQNLSNDVAGNLARLYGDRYEGIFRVNELNDRKKRTTELSSIFLDYAERLGVLVGDVREAKPRGSLPKALEESGQILDSTTHTIHALGQRWGRLANGLASYRKQISQSQNAYTQAPSAKLRKDINRQISKLDREWFGLLLHEV